MSDEELAFKNAAVLFCFLSFYPYDAQQLLTKTQACQLEKQLSPWFTIEDFSDYQNFDDFLIKYKLYVLESGTNKFDAFCIDENLTNSVDFFSKALKSIFQKAIASIVLRNLDQLHNHSLLDSTEIPLSQKEKQLLTKRLQTKKIQKNQPTFIKILRQASEKHRTLSHFVLISPQNDYTKLNNQQLQPYFKRFLRAVVETPTILQVLLNELNSQQTLTIVNTGHLMTLKDNSACYIKTDGMKDFFIFMHDKPQLFTQITNFVCRRLQMIIDFGKTHHSSSNTPHEQQYHRSPIHSGSQSAPTRHLPPSPLAHTSRSNSSPPIMDTTPKLT